MKETPLQIKLPGVPLAKPGREIPTRWEWTERRLATLERGITGGQWYSLIDKVWKMENLPRAVEKVIQGKSPKKNDGRQCRRYAEQSDQRLPRLQRNIQTGPYQPKPVQRVLIPKLGSQEFRP